MAQPYSVIVLIWAEAAACNRAEFESDALGWRISMIRAGGATQRGCCARRGRAAGNPILVALGVARLNQGVQPRSRRRPPSNRERELHAAASREGKDGGGGPEPLKHLGWLRVAVK